MSYTQTSTTAVFSLFNPDHSVLTNVQAVKDQVDNVIVVNDGSTADIQEILASLRSEGCQIIDLPENGGIAAALNTGIRQALSNQQHPPDFILTMDQDSRLDQGYVASMIGDYATAVAAGIEVGMVAPGTIAGLPLPSKRTFGSVDLGGEPIQSGLLVPTGSFRKIGLLMEELFIDGVDSEFYLRAKVAGYAVVLSPGAALNHSLGSMTKASLFGLGISIRGKAIEVRKAATMRYYYIYRNRLALIGMYWRQEPLWAVKGISTDLRHLAIVTLLVPGRLARLSEVAKGVMDGIHGVLGPESSTRVSHSAQAPSSTP